MLLTVNGKIFTAALEESTAMEALAERLEESPLTVKASDYSGFEKVIALGFSLPASDKYMTTSPGDIVLYGGDKIVLFYGSNTWDYTKLAHVEDLDGWNDALGSGDVSITIELKKD